MDKKLARGLLCFLAAAVVLAWGTLAFAEEGLIGAGAAAVSKKSGAGASVGSAAASQTAAMAAGVASVTASGGALSAGVAQTESYVTVIGAAAETLAGATGQEDTDAHGHGSGHGE